MTGPARTATSSYRLAPALGVRLVGRCLVTLAVLVFVATFLGPLIGSGWLVAAGATVAGLALVGLWAWYLLRIAWAVRLTEHGYAVRLIRGVGTPAASWADVDEVVTASPADLDLLVVRLRNGTQTRLPMAALAADPDTFAHDVRTRLRDAHTPGGPPAEAAPS